MYRKTLIFIVMAIFLTGCMPRSMTKKQFKSSWKTQTSQLTDEQLKKVDDPSVCTSLGEYEVKSMGMTISHDVSRAGDKVDGIIDERGGNTYYLSDFEWISDSLGGTTLHILFTVYKCDAGRL